VPTLALPLATGVIYLNKYKFMQNMSTNTLRYSPEEFSVKGTQIYQNQILPNLDRDDDGKTVAIDIETGEFELADTTLAAAAKMFIRAASASPSRLPTAQLWFERIGAQSVHRFNSVYPA
jgi:hypothetical protein